MASCRWQFYKHLSETASYRAGQNPFMDLLVKDNAGAKRQLTDAREAIKQLNRKLRKAQ